MKALRRWLAVSAAVVVAGCGSAPAPSAVGTSSTPSASPSPTCSPFGSTPRPCSPAEFSETQKQNALIAEAERTYQAYWTEKERLYRSGGVNKPTQALLDTLEGDALKSVMAIFQDLKANKTKAEGGSYDILSITPRPTRVKGNSAMSLTVCWRTKGVTFRVDGVTIKSDSTVRGDTYFRRTGGKLRIFTIESEKVSKC